MAVCQVCVKSGEEGWSLQRPGIGRSGGEATILGHNTAAIGVNNISKLICLCEEEGP